MCTATTNPVAVDVSQDHKIYLHCIAHAGFQQKVTASFNADLSNPFAIFTGTGENVPMTYEGEKMIEVFTGVQSKLYLLFQFSSGSGFQNAGKVCQPLKIGYVTQITSEDFVDNDTNDSYLIIVDTAAARS